MTTSEHADYTVRGGVCLTCGDGLMLDGGHIDPERHLAALASTPSPAQPTEASEREALARITFSAQNPDLDVDYFFEETDPRKHYAIADAILAAGFRLAPSPVQGADDRLAQAALEAIEMAYENMHLSLSEFRSVVYDVLATYQQSPQAALNEVRADSAAYEPDAARELLGMAPDEPNAATGWNTRLEFQRLTGALE